MEKLGINTTYLITQIINFVILVVVLGRFVYKPILKALEVRKKKIEEGLKLTQKLTEEKQKIEIERTKIIKDANSEARAVTEKARVAGKKIEEEIIKEARVKASEIIERGKKDVDVRRKEMESLLAKETVDIAALLTRKIIGEVLDEKKQQDLIKKRISLFLKERKIS